MIEDMEPQRWPGLVRLESVRPHLRLNVPQQRHQIRLLRHPLTLPALLVSHQLVQLVLGIDVSALKGGLLPPLLLRPDLLQQLLHAALERVLHLPGASHVCDELLDPPPRIFHPFHLREGVKPVGDVSHERALVRFRDVTDVLDVQQVGDPDFFGRNVKRQLHVAAMIGLVEAVVVDQVGSMDVEQGTAIRPLAREVIPANPGNIQCQPIIPAGRKVPNVNIVVAGRFPLTPQQQALLGRHALFVDIADGEP